MLDAGILLNSNAPQIARNICVSLDYGASPLYIAGDILSANPTWYADQAIAFVALAQDIYCPVTAA